MIEILLFSLSISVDAFGYGASLSTRKVKLSKLEFFLINIINSIILSLFIIALSYIPWLVENQFTEKLSSFLLLFMGLYYVFVAFLKLFKTENEKIFLFVKSKNDGIISLFDFFVLILVFIFEDCFSAFIFQTNFSDGLLFITSNFVFHYLLFLLGYDIGRKMVSKIKFDSSFISGYIFLILVFFNL